MISRKEVTIFYNNNNNNEMLEDLEEIKNIDYIEIISYGIDEELKESYIKMIVY